MKKKLAILGLLLALLAQGTLGGRSAFEAVATVEKSVFEHSWLNGDTWDTYMRGADGKVFMLHFHEHNALAALEGRLVKVIYVQSETSCQTGYVDETVSIIDVTR